MLLEKKDILITFGLENSNKKVIFNAIDYDSSTFSRQKYMAQTFQIKEVCMALVFGCTCRLNIYVDGTRGKGHL